MAKSNAERLCELKARKKEEEKIASLTLDGIFKRLFCASLPEDFHLASDFEDPLAFVGIPVPEFINDRGIEDFTHYSPELAAETIQPNRGPLSRAEVMITALTEAAETLAFHVNAYKRREIRARLAEIEASDLCPTPP